jgi:hypothetical protein
LLDGAELAGDVSVEGRIEVNIDLRNVRDWRRTSRGSGRVGNGGSFLPFFFDLEITPPPAAGRIGSEETSMLIIVRTRFKDLRSVSPINSFVPSAFLSKVGAIDCKNEVKALRRSKKIVGGTEEMNAILELDVVGAVEIDCRVVIADRVTRRV